MGLRGPLQSPDSVRGLKANAGALPDPEHLVAPAWLKKRAREVFDKLVSDAMDGGVPTKACDAHMFAMAAQCTVDYQSAKNSLDRARIGRDLEKFLAVIGATPAARMRMGIKAKPKTESKTSRLLSMVNRPQPESEQSA